MSRNSMMSIRMKVRFQADADLHQLIVTALVRRTPRVDFHTATAAGLVGEHELIGLLNAGQAISECCSLRSSHDA
jgi:hypothetical protein